MIFILGMEYMMKKLISLKNTEKNLWIFRSIN